MAQQIALTFDSMTDDEALVWQVLQDYVGKESAINQRGLSELTCVSERTVRKVLTSLIIKHRKMICSSYESGKGGYYIPANEAEVKETCERLHNHAMQILMRESAMRKISTKQLLAEYQNDLPFEEDSPHV